jgi:DNA adenine methylase
LSAIGQPAVTPFRYPGGKGFLFPDIQKRIERCSPLRPSSYAEPYAGGAGAAIRLLAGGHVQDIYLNDFDWRIYSAWSAMLNHSARFIERIHSIKLNVETWKGQKAIVDSANQDTNSQFDVGFATFFLNRTNRSGIVSGAGPIGGYDQTGKWKIDARFPRDTLAERVAWLAERADQITLSNDDGLQFLRRMSSERGRETFFFIDPPYVSAGSRLYMNAMSEALHMNLAAFLIANRDMPHWLVTYDDCSLIRASYQKAVIEDLTVKYSLQLKRAAGELLIAPAA